MRWIAPVRVKTVREFATRVTRVRRDHLPRNFGAEQIMAMPAFETHRWTAAEVRKLTADNPLFTPRYELVDEELLVTSSPSAPHQRTVAALYRALHAYLSATRGGEAYVSPSDVELEPEFLSQPDVFVVRLVEGKRPAYPYELHDLLLAVEVVSPSNPILDYQVKRDLYLREGVGEYWVVNPDARNVSRWRGRDDPGDVLSKEVVWNLLGMPAPLVLDLAEFFADALSY